MGLDILLIISSVIVPVIMIAGGFFMYKKPPEKINDFVGYRTSMSKKSPETWAFAHDFCGKLWLKCGTVLLVVSAAAVVAVWLSDSGNRTAVSCILLTVQTVLLILSVVPVERALKNNFDSEGKRKNGRD